MYEIYVRESFSAAHSLKGYPGKCERKHGHNWIVEIYIQCPDLNSIGIGIDFREIKEALKEIIKNLDHRDLNKISPFNKENPSSENIARYIYNKIKSKITLKISKIRVSESISSGVIYYPNE